MWTLVPNAEIWLGNIIQTTLSQHYKNIVKSWNFQLYHTIMTMLPECCVNIVGQLKYNIHTMLYQRWGITLFSMLPQGCYNVAGTQEAWQILFPISTKKIQNDKINSFSLLKIMIYLYGQNYHNRKHNLVVLKMKTLHSKTVLESVSDMESLHSNTAVWIYMEKCHSGTKSLGLSRPKKALDTNVRTTFTQCCLTISSNVQHKGVLPPHNSQNFALKLSQCWRVMLPQRSHNTGPTPFTNVGERCCHNIHTTLVQNSWDNIVATLWFWLKCNRVS